MAPRGPLAALLAVSLLLPSCRIAGDRHAANETVRITFDAGTRYQTIEGWGGVLANWHWVDGGSGPSVPFAPSVREQAMRELVFDLGLNRFGMDLPPVGIESVNDNDDPFQTNVAAFDFSNVDPYIHQMAIPLREMVRSRGEPFVFYLNAVLWAPKPGGPRFLVEDANEYVEFALTTLRHFRQQGLEVDYWVMQNEPDLIGTWTPGYLGRLIARLGERIRAAGFRTRIAAPEAMRPATVASWLSGTAATPGAAQYLGQVTFHSYDYDPSKGQRPPAIPRAAVAEAARQLGLSVAQTEQGQSGKIYSDRWSRSYTGIGMGLARNLFADVALADAAAWQLHAVAGWANADQPVVAGTFINFHRDAESYSKGFHYWTLRQVMRYVRPGAVRVAARVRPEVISPIYENRVAALGFITLQKTVVLALLNTGPNRSVQVSGLPAGEYAASITTPTQQGEELEPLRVGANGELRLELPRDAVLTLRQQSSALADAGLSVYSSSPTAP